LTEYFRSATEKSVVTTSPRPLKVYRKTS